MSVAVQSQAASPAGSLTIAAITARNRPQEEQDHDSNPPKANESNDDPSTSQSQHVDLQKEGENYESSEQLQEQTANAQSSKVQRDQTSESSTNPHDFAKLD